MKRRLLELLGVFPVVTTVFIVLLLTAIPSQGQTEDTNEWGRPNLEGIWLDVYATPFERAPELGDREFTTPEERAARDQALSSSAGRDRRGPRAEAVLVACVLCGVPGGLLLLVLTGAARRGVHKTCLGPTTQSIPQ